MRSFGWRQTWRRWQSWRPVAIYGWVFGYLAVICSQRVDADFGWHFRSGQYILAHGIPYHDVFTYTARDFAWVNHEWLSDLVMYGLTQLVGLVGLGMVFAAIWTGAVMLAAGWRLTWLGAGLALGGLVLYAGARPVAWTALGLVLLLAVLRSGSKRYWTLGPIFLLWANLHAGFALGLAVVGLAAGLRRERRLAAWLVVAVATTLVNPYGWGVYQELWRTMTDGQLGRFIVEWAPLSPNTAVVPFVLASLTVLVLGRRWTFDWIRGVALVAATAWSNRFMPLLVVGFLGVVNGEIWRGMRLIANWRGLVVRQWLGVVGAVLGIGLGVGYPLLLLAVPPAVDAGVKLARPEQALQALRDEPCQGNVFNDYSYGGLMIWELPGVPDYIDGRMPSWRGPQGRYLDRYVAVLQGGQMMQDEFARYNVHCVLISKLDTKLSAVLKRKPGWRLVVWAQDAQLWRREP